MDDGVELSNRIVYPIEMLLYIAGIPSLIFILSFTVGFQLMQKNLRVIACLYFSFILSFASFRVAELVCNIMQSYGVKGLTELYFDLLAIYNAFIMLTDSFILLIAFERLLAIVFEKSYEHVWNSYRNGFLMSLLTSILTIPMIMIGLDDNLAFTTIIIEAAITILSTISLFSIRFYYRYAEKSYHFNKSYQRTHNLNILGAILPIFTITAVLRFVSLMLMYASLTSMHDFFASSHSVLSRLLMHAYNLTMAIFVLGSPWLVLLLHPLYKTKLQKRFCRRSSSVADAQLINSNRDKETTDYFNYLAKQWG